MTIELNGPAAAVLIVFMLCITLLAMVTIAQKKEKPSGDRDTADRGTHSGNGPFS